MIDEILTSKASNVASKVPYLISEGFMPALRPRRTILSIDPTRALTPDRIRIPVKRHRFWGAVAAGLAILGTSTVGPVVAQSDAKTMAASMVDRSGRSFLTISGEETKADWYDAVATIKRTPCEHETFHLGIVASLSDDLFRTSYDATIRMLRIRSLRGRSISCARSLPRGVGRRLTKMVIYAVGTSPSKAPFTIVSRRTSASGSRFTGRIEARSVPCPGRYRMRLTFSSRAQRIVQRYELSISDVLINGVAHGACR